MNGKVFRDAAMVNGMTVHLIPGAYECDINYPLEIYGDNVSVVAMGNGGYICTKL